MEYADGKLLAETRDDIGWITFNQPEKRNALSVEMWDGLRQVLEAWAGDEAVRVVVLAGQGEEAFISGADISQFEALRANAEQQAAYQLRVAGGYASLAIFPKPIIAAVRGYCLGGGLMVALRADFRIASETARFGVPAARMGIVYSPEGVRDLIGLVGLGPARSILLTARRVDAAEAFAMGLADRVVPATEFDGAVLELARTLAGNAPLSVRGMKLVIRELMKDGAERDEAAMGVAVARAFDSEDYREGRRAFMEKRKPAFKGR